MRTRKNNGFKKIIFIYGGILLVLFVTCIIIYSSYNKKLQESTKQSMLAAQKIENTIPNNILVEASSELSKSISEQLDENKDEALDKALEDMLTETNANVSNNEQTETSINTEQQAVEEVKPLEFIYPVNGEIVKEYAREKLVFSETLQEWIIHNGIDIKAPRTTVVKSVEDGIVTGIKNDPRYGLTVIIEHREGYKSIYANLLTAEFVTEGDTITKGQTLGTIGNSAIFEIVDEPHLHFELLKDEEYIDPTLYLK